MVSERPEKARRLKKAAKTTKRAIILGRNATGKPAEVETL